MSERLIERLSKDQIEAIFDALPIEKKISNGGILKWITLMR